MTKHVTLREMKELVQEKTGQTWRHWSSEKGFDYALVRRVLCGDVKGKYGKSFLVRKAVENDYKNLVNHELG